MSKEYSLEKFKPDQKIAESTIDKDHRLDKDDIRNIFQRDRDRIMYCKAFRRLSGKTQVFLSSHDNHLRTRLTHTLEVAQIAKEKKIIPQNNIEEINYGKKSILQFPL